MIRILIGIIVICGLIVMARGLFSHVHTSTLSAAVSSPIPYVPLAAPSDKVPFTITGTAIMDTSGGIPPIPYIEYADANGRKATKQLIFADERGCLGNAGDIPCVPSYPQQAAYPKLTTGENITATGYIRENRLLVTKLSEW